MKWNFAITDGSILQNINDGTIHQTIRECYNCSTKDLIAFHGWKGRPYRSKWADRTPYFLVTEVIEADVTANGISWPSSKQISSKPIPYDIDEWGHTKWSDLGILATQEGVAPPTGKGLRDVLLRGRRLSPGESFHAEIIRWDPNSLKEGSACS